MSLPAKKISAASLGPLAPFDAGRVPVMSLGTSEDRPFAAGYPQAFGPYALLKSFAHGGMGQVFLAQSGGLQGLEKLCVVKKLRADLTENREYIRRFLDEARVVVQLNHANICHVFDVGCVGSDYYLAMEYVAGVNLRALFHRAKEKNHPISESVALFALREVLEALDYAHRLTHPLTGQSLRLVHRDVSPQNVMLSYEGETKLIDFGLAASDLKEEHTQGDVVMGKVAYMSPEQARGAAIDAQTDQFAAAVLVYELLVGERYYGDLSTHQIWQVVGTGNFIPPAWERLPRKLQSILSRALAARAQDRFPTCGDFGEELLGYLNAKSVIPSKRQMRTFVHQLFADEIERDRKQLAGWIQHLRTSPSVIRQNIPNPSLIETAPHDASCPADASIRASVDPAPTTTASSRLQSPPRESTQRFEALPPHDKELLQRPMMLREVQAQLENTSTLALVQMAMGPRRLQRYAKWMAGAILLIGLFLFVGTQEYRGRENSADDSKRSPLAQAPLETTAPPSQPIAPTSEDMVAHEPLPTAAIQVAAAPKPASPPSAARTPATRNMPSPPRETRKAIPPSRKMAAAEVSPPVVNRAERTTPERPVTEDDSHQRQLWRDRVVKRLSTCPASCAQTLLGSSSALSSGHPLDVSEQDFRAISFTVERCLRSCEK